jgi:hypothetical protein
MIARIEALTTSVDTLAEEVHSLRGEVRKRTAALWAAIVVCGVVVLIIGGIAFTVGLNNQRALAENNRRWCPVVEVMLPNPGEAPPESERGRNLVASARQLYRDFGCA